MAARKDASRREILKLATVGTGGLAIVPLLVTRGATWAAVKPARSSSSRVSAAKTTAAQPRAQSVVEDSRGFLADLGGQQLGPYRVESVGALHRGGIPVEMKTSSGVRFRVDVLRFDPSEGLRGIGASSALTVVLCNGGKGRKATDEELGLGAMALAAELVRREGEGALPPPGLRTMGQRASDDGSLAAPIDASLT